MDETRKLIISVLVIVVVLVGLGVATYFGVRSWKETKQDLAGKQAQLTTVNNKIAQIPALQQKRDILTQGQKVAEEVLPDAREVEKLDTVLYAFEEQSGVNLDVVSRKPRAAAPAPRGKASKKPYEQYTYTLKGRGSFFALINFLSLVETYKRFIQLDSFDIKAKSEEYPVNDFSIDVSTFSYRKKAAATAPAASAPPGVQQ